MSRPTAQALLETVRSLKIDTVTAEVVQSLSSEGIESILLKGSSVVRLLYNDGAPRPYSDSDILVPFAQLTKAETVLRSLGFRLRLPGRLQGRSDRVHHASAWSRRSDSVTVDLHHTLPRAPVAPQLVWDTLSKHRRFAMVGGAPVWELDEGAICLQVAVHVAQHGVDDEVAMRDLERALKLPPSTWTTAAALAGELGLTAELVHALRASAEGPSLLRQLGLSMVQPNVAPAHPRWESGMTWLMVELGNAEGGQKIKILARLIFPTPSFMKGAWAIARRGALGLTCAYFIHPLYLAVELLRTAIGRKQ